MSKNKQKKQKKRQGKKKSKKKNGELSNNILYMHHINIETSYGLESQ